MAHPISSLVVLARINRPIHHPRGNRVKAQAVRQMAQQHHHRRIRTKTAKVKAVKVNLVRGPVKDRVKEAKDRDRAVEVEVEVAKVRGLDRELVVKAAYVVARAQVAEI